MNSGRKSETISQPNRNARNASSGNRRAAVQVQDAEVEEDTVQTIVSFDKTPNYIKSGEMRDYQVRGLNWLISLYENGINGILADEMGLGKTLQTISLLGYLQQFHQIHGPHLVVAPKSTLQNWVNEVQRWCPSLKPFCLIGEKAKREELIQTVLLRGKWNVCVTSYEMCDKAKVYLQRIKWSFIVVDEAQKIKNEKTILAKILRQLSSTNRLMLTGTPLQNNLHELWALLNFLLPDVFNNSDDFDTWFDTNKCLGDMTLVERLHAVLKPFLLRRVKAEVEKGLLPKKEVKVFVGLSKMQQEWYRKVLLKNVDLVNGAGDVRKMRLENLLMHLRKVTSHPYLFPGAEEGPPFTTDQHLIDNSGKMIVLDKLLARLKEQGSRVLIFTQFRIMIPILEDFFWLRKYKYHVLHGMTNHEDRSSQIDEFNSPGSETFIYLLSTRAGGLGVNLASADVVILYDSDWNPQVDLQAMDRVHRIGQLKQVRVFRLITENTIEEKIVERAEIKMRLDKLVIQQGRLVDKKTENLNSGSLSDIVRFGAKDIIQGKFADLKHNVEDIDELLLRCEKRTDEERKKLEQMNEESLRNLTLESHSSSYSLYQFEGKDWREKEKADTSLSEPTPRAALKRSCRSKLAVDSYLVDEEPAPTPPGQPTIHDFQFFPKRLHQLLAKETLFYQKNLGYDVPLDPELSIGAAAQIQVEKQCKIDAAEPLTKAEINEKESLLNAGFPNWSKLDFDQFVAANERYGRHDLKSISHQIATKTPEEVVQYSFVFWQRIDELGNSKAIRERIQKGEAKINEYAYLSIILKEKIESCPDPMNEMRINYDNTEPTKYSKEADRFLLYQIHEIGLASDDVFVKLQTIISCASQFAMDWHLKSRSAADLEKRVMELLYLIKKERLIQPNDVLNDVQTENNEIKYELPPIEIKQEVEEKVVVMESSVRNLEESEIKQEAAVDVVQIASNKRKVEADEMEANKRIKMEMSSPLQDKTNTM